MIRPPPRSTLFPYPGKLRVPVAETVVRGIVEGCVQAGAALVGGETAEMPGMYHGEDYDLAGFCVGVVEKDAIVDGARVRAGDAIIGLASSGPHSNGYALIRKLLVAAGASATTSLEGRSLLDRKSTRLNSSHGYISYAVFCLKK